MAMWPTWQDFKAAQQAIELPAQTVAHIPVTIRYIDVGPATQSAESQETKSQGTVLLMHGIPTWGYLYHGVIPLLQEAGYRVIAPDFLGHGWSDRRDRFDRSFQDQARMIAALLAALDLGPVHVVGHDTGGAVALILAIERAGLVDRLVISNSVCYDRFDDDMLDFGHPLRWQSKSVAELEAALEASLSMGLSRPERLTAEFRSGIIAPWASEEGKLSLLRNASALNANQTMALVDRHGSITAPTLVLWGMDDPWQMAEDGRRLASEIPGARFQPIAHASHWVQQDAPEDFAAAVLAFLAAPASQGQASATAWAR